MRRNNWLFLTLLLCLFQIISSQENRKVLIIDPGHGGMDSGAVSVQGLKEKDVVLAIAQEMLVWNKILLEDTYDIYLTRGRDTLISLGDRTRLAGHLKPDLFISLHCNHSDNGKAKGVEVFIHMESGPQTKLIGKSRIISKTLLEGLNNNLGFENRDIQQGDFQVLRETMNVCPALLIELGFLSNSDESRHLMDREKRRALALAILMAIKLE